MNNENKKKKELIDTVLKKYRAEMVVLKRRHDKVIIDFLETLKENKIEEVRNVLKNL